MPKWPRRTAPEAVSNGKLADDDDEVMVTGKLVLGARALESRDRRVARAGRPSTLAQDALPSMAGCTALKAVSNGESRELKGEPAGATRRFDVVIGVESVVGGWSAQAKVP